MELWEYNLLSRVKRVWVLLTVIFLILSAASGYGYYTTPPIQDSKVKITSTLYTWSGELEGRGVVLKPNPLWEVGKKVELPIYPLSITPLAEVELKFNVTGKDVRLQFERDIKAVYYLSYEDKRVIEEVYKVISNTSVGSCFSEHLTLDVNDIFDRIEEARNVLRLPREKIGVEIIGKVRYSGTVDGKPVKGSQEFKGSISFPYEAFYMISGENKNGTETFTETTSKTSPANQKKRTVLLSLSLLFGVLAVGTAIIGTKFKPNLYDIQELAFRRERRKLSKWISSGKLPTILPSEKVELASLTDLVEAAIDMNKRVIYDSEEHIYFFLSEGVLYYFKERSIGEKK